MPGTARTFDSSTTAWRQWQDAPWGRLRFALAEANLLRHLDRLGGGSLRILDLAGGDGGDAVRPAARGHRVTVVDHAPAMPAAAGERAEAAGVADRVARVEELPEGIASGGWDVVLCHSVLRSSGTRTRPGRGADGRTFGITMALHTAEEIASPLDGPGCPRADHCGIRSVCDYIADDERKHDPAFYADLERLEPAVTARPAYRHTVRLLQSVARREPAACAPPARAGA